MARPRATSSRLRRILSRAVEDDRLVKNACRIERGGVGHHPEQRSATMADLVTLADTAAGAPQPVPPEGGSTTRAARLEEVAEGENRVTVRVQVELRHNTGSVQRAPNGKVDYTGARARALQALTANV